LQLFLTMLDLTARQVFARIGTAAVAMLPDCKLADAAVDHEVVRPTTASRIAVSPPSSISTTSPGGLS
jgi:hypothetical protein